jgi:hypothetical protein
MASCSAAGAAVPSCHEKLREVGVGVMVGCVTTTLTLTTCEVAPVAEIVTVPLKVPTVVKTDVFTEAFTVPGVVPEVVSIISHEPPVDVAGVAAKPILAVPPTLIGCEAGAVLPI